MNEEPSLKVLRLEDQSHPLELVSLQQNFDKSHQVGADKSHPWSSLSGKELAASLIEVLPETNFEGFTKVWKKIQETSEIWFTTQSNRHMDLFLSQHRLLPKAHHLVGPHVPSFLKRAIGMVPYPKSGENPFARIFEVAEEVSNQEPEDYSHISNPLYQAYYRKHKPKFDEVSQGSDSPSRAVDYLRTCAKSLPIEQQIDTLVKTLNSTLEWHTFCKEHAVGYNLTQEELISFVTFLVGENIRPASLGSRGETIAYAHTPSKRNANDGRIDPNDKRAA